MTDSPSSSSPPKPSSSFAPRYLFLSPQREDLLATRGQVLPSLLKQSGSSASLFALGRRQSFDWDDEALTPTRPELRRKSTIPAAVLLTPEMRSQRLIGHSNPRYDWQQYLKSDDELSSIKKGGLRDYYKHINALCLRFMYIDRLLDSSLPHNLIQEYDHENAPVDIPATIPEEPAHSASPPIDRASAASLQALASGQSTPPARVKRTQKSLFRISDDEETPLLNEESENPKPRDDATWKKAREEAGADDDEEDGERIIQVAIYVNLAANTALLAGKIVVMLLTSSLSVLASLVDAALDFLSTGIIWTTSWLMTRRDPYAYPVGRSRLEPLGVLVFSVIMVTSFFQVALECLQTLLGSEHTVVQLGWPAIAIMASTVIIKFGCWLWCRLIKNSGVQALAQDAMTDVVFNIFSIIFPLSKSYEYNLAN
jgi:hypothetical protein